MEDQKIVSLFWERDPEAISQASVQYGAYCFSIAQGILNNREDSQECVNDTWLQAWNCIPPRKPAVLRAFLGKITRNIAISLYRSETAQKRGGGQLPLVLEELSYCIAGNADPEERYSAKELGKSVNSFVKALPQRDGNVFVRRYYFTESIESIAQRYGLQESYVLVILHRTRNKLRKHLIREGLIHG